MDSYVDISEPSGAGDLLGESPDLQVSVMGSEIVHRIVHKGASLKVSASLAGERSVDFDSSYVYLWTVRLTSNQLAPAVNKEVEVEIALSERLGAIAESSPTRETTTPASGSASIGIPTVGSIGIGFSPGTIEVVSAQRKDLGRMYWLFQKRAVAKVDKFQWVVGGSFSVITYARPYASSINKIPEYFPIRILVRTGFTSRRQWKRLFLFPEVVVAMPSFLFLLQRPWGQSDQRDDEMSG